MVGSGAALRSRTEESGPRVRLVVLSDRRLFREALVAGIAACTQCAILGHASNINDALLLCRLCRPNAVVLDVDCRGPHARLGELAAVVRVVAVYDRLSPADVNTLRSCGVYNLVSMSDGLDGLLRQLLRGETFAMVDESSVELVAGLTTLECTILRHLGDGQTAEGLARELGISLTAVTNANGGPGDGCLAGTSARWL